LRLQQEVRDMKKIFFSCLLLVLWLCLEGSSVWAIDVGWIQQGVRVWYFGGVGSVTASDAEEAYLFDDINGNNVQVTKHSGMNHWGTAHPIDTDTYSFLDKGPCWIHPQKLQALQSGDTWKGQTIATVLRESHTYDTFKARFSFPYLLLPIKALFDLKSQRNLVKIVYYLSAFSTGIAYFDADTGLLLLYETSNGYVTVFFLLSEINYDFAAQQAFAEDNGPHTGFKSFVLEQQMMPFPDSRGGAVLIQTSVESRYGSTLQMWASTSVNGSSRPFENYCFFGGVPVLRRMDMTQAPNYPPDQWDPYGQHLWWWVPAEALQHATINVFGVPMTKTSTNPYIFTATQQSTDFFFSRLWFDNDGYMTQFAAKDSSTGLDIDPERIASYYNNSTTVEGLSYYKDTMGRAVPSASQYTLTVNKASTGGGSITPSTGKLTWSGKSGTATYDYNTSVILTATAAAGSVFTEWEGCDSIAGSKCTVTMTADRTVTAGFDKVWSTNPKVNNAISTAARDQINPRITSDGSGGALVTWQDNRIATNPNIYAQRIDSTGNILWKLNGVLTNGAANDQSNPQIVSDGGGGAIIAWQDNRSGTNPNIYAQKIDKNGHVLWTANGVPISIAANDQINPRIVSDGSGGAIIAWEDFRSGDGNIYAQKINADGAIKWTANGKAITGAANDQINPRIASDGSGGAIITWEDFRSGNGNIYAQKINAAGAIKWAANGKAITGAANDQIKPQIVGDGSGGAIITWQDGRIAANPNIYAQRIDAAGTPKWRTNGVVITGAVNDQGNPQIVGDGSGGAIIAWEDNRSATDTDIYARRIDPSGMVMWAAAGAAISTAAHDQIDPRMIGDGFGGALITWDDFRSGSNHDIYIQKVESNGKFPTAPSTLDSDIADF